MTAKLRPEQRKLWRRIYLTAFDTDATVDDAATMADKAVAQWEERGAFEAEPSAPPISMTTTWDAFSSTVARMLEEGRTTEQIAELRVAYPDEFDFMRELVTTQTQPKFDTEHLSRLQQCLEPGKTVACINGIIAGHVTHVEGINSTERPIMKLRLTVEASFSLA